MAFYVPENIITNQIIIDQHELRIKASWIESKIGITQRRWGATHETASSLATEAIKKLNLTHFDGALWVSTISQDYLTPSTASIIKHNLQQMAPQINSSEHYPAVDLNAACAGQIFALEMAMQRLMATEETESLVVATEMRSRFLDKKDRRTVFLFADGACVFHLKKINQEETWQGEIHWTKTLTIPSEFFEILIPAGGSARPIRTLEDIEAGFITMRDGERIVQMTTTHLLEIIQKQLALQKQSVDDFDFFVFHQGNGAIITSICQTLGIPLEKTWINFDRFGNTSSASMGIAFAEALLLKKIRPAQKVLIMAMGAGHHIAMASLTLGNTLGDLSL